MPTLMAGGFDLDEALIAAGLVKREDHVTVIAIECNCDSEITLTTKRFLTVEECAAFGRALADGAARKAADLQIRLDKIFGTVAVNGVPGATEPFERNDGHAGSEPR